MIFKVIGIQPVSYTSKKTGQLVEGTQLHVSFEDTRVKGLAVDKIFCGKRIPVDHVKINDCIEVFYNRYGQVDFVGVK